MCDLLKQRVADVVMWLTSPGHASSAKDGDRMIETVRLVVALYECLPHLTLMAKGCDARPIHTSEGVVARELKLAYGTYVETHREPAATPEQKKLVTEKLVYHIGRAAATFHELACGEY